MNLMLIDKSISAIKILILIKMPIPDDLQYQYKRIDDDKDEIVDRIIDKVQEMK